MKRFPFRAVRAAMAAAVFTLTLIAPCAAEITQEDLDDLDRQIQEQEKVIADIEDKTASNQEYLDALEKELSLSEQKLQQTQSEISSLNDQITQTEEQIAHQQEKIDATYAQLAKRLRSMYMNGQTSPLEMLFSSADYSTFLMSLELVSRTSAYDSEMIDSFKALIDEQNKQKESLTAQKADLETQRAQEEQEQADMQTKVDRQRELLDELDADSAQAVAIRQELEDQMDAYEEQIRQQAASGSQGDGTISGGGSSGGSSSTDIEGADFAWPLMDVAYGNGAYISSDYGPRTDPYTGFHKGLDITCGGAQGKRICAAEAGTVIVAAYGWNGGYGNYVIIDHGNGLSTLYGHCESLSVSVGQQVSRGEFIANVGNTGNSFGPHCHFEVRINGSHTNPRPYLSAYLG